MTDQKKPRRFGAEHQIRQARRAKDYDKRVAKALGNGSLGRAADIGGERAVRELLTKGNK